MPGGTPTKILKIAKPTITCKVGTQSTSDIFVNGFGLDSQSPVSEDTSGTLGGSMSGTIANNGNAVLAAGYTVEATITTMLLKVVGGTAAFVQGVTLFDCKKSGPSIASGQSKVMTFSFGKGGCPPLKLNGALITILPCGLYCETLTITGTSQGKPFKSKCMRYIYVPSSVKDIKIDLTSNPDGLPLTPNGYVEIGYKDRFNLVAPLCPKSSFKGNAVKIVITAKPGQSLFIATGKGRIDQVSGASTDFSPTLPLGKPAGIKGPRTINYVLTVPNTRFASAPCNDIGPPPCYEAKLDTTITVISVERSSVGSLIFGCVIRQKTLRVSALFECR